MPTIPVESKDILRAARSYATLIKLHRMEDKRGHLTAMERLERDAHTAAVRVFFAGLYNAAKAAGGTHDPT